MAHIGPGKFVGVVEDIGVEQTKSNWRLWCAVTPIKVFNPDETTLDLENANIVYIDTYLYKKTGQENPIATKQLKTAFDGWDGVNIKQLADGETFIGREVVFENQEEDDVKVAGKKNLKATFPFPEFRKKASTKDMAVLDQMRARTAGFAAPSAVYQPSYEPQQSTRDEAGFPTEQLVDDSQLNTEDDLPF